MIFRTRFAAFAALALALAGCLDLSDAPGRPVENPQDIKVGDTLNPPADTSKKTGDTVKTTVDTVKIPADTIKTPVDTVKVPVDSGKTPIDTIKHMPWDDKRLPCHFEACPDSATRPGDTLYFTHRKNGELAMAALAVEPWMSGLNFMQVLQGLLMGPETGAGRGTIVEISYEQQAGSDLRRIVIWGNPSPIVDLKVYNSRFGLTWKPLQIPVWSQPYPRTSVLQIFAKFPPADCRIQECPDSLSGPGDTLFFDALKDGNTVSTRFVIGQSAEEICFALTAFFRKDLNAGLGTAVDLVTISDSWEKLGLITIYGNTVGIAGLRIRSSRLGEIAGPIDAKAGTTRLTKTFAIPNILYQWWVQPAY